MSVHTRHTGGVKIGGKTLRKGIFSINENIPLGNVQSVIKTLWGYKQWGLHHWGINPYLGRLIRTVDTNEIQNKLFRTLCFKFEKYSTV